LIESPTINSPEKFTSGDAAGDHANFCSARPGCRITSADGRTVISISLRCFDSCFLRGQAALLGLRGIAINAPVTDSREPNFTELEPLLCVSISPTKRISRAPYRLHKRHQ
jgi:hypothetical protein